MTKINKKGQEEMVGFVAIIVIVTVIGLVILGFLMSNQSSENTKDNRDLLRFMESTLAYTSDCTLDYGYTYKNLKELSKLCYQKPDEVCLNGDNVCIALNNSLKGILKAGWGEVDNSTFTKGYVYSSVFSKNTTDGLETLEFLSIEEGTCDNSDFRGYSLPISTNPNIYAKIRVCLSKE